MLRIDKGEAKQGIQQYFRQLKTPFDSKIAKFSCLLVCCMSEVLKMENDMSRDFPGSVEYLV